VSRACYAHARAFGIDPVDLAIQGGEDYELLFTVSPAKAVRLDRLMHQKGHRVARIGAIKPKVFGLRLRGSNGALRRLPMVSYRHFQKVRQPQREAAWSQ
jgi:thiamine-monophosphate kinase